MKLPPMLVRMFFHTAPNSCTETTKFKYNPHRLKDRYTRKRHGWCCSQSRNFHVVDGSENCVSYNEKYFITRNKSGSGNCAEPSPKEILAESSDKRVSAQYLRHNLQPIYQISLFLTLIPPLLFIITFLKPLLSFVFRAFCV